MTDSTERTTVFKQSIASQAQSMGEEKTRILDWNIQPQDFVVIEYITRRVIDLFNKYNVQVQNHPFLPGGRIIVQDGGLQIKMDLTCIHLNYKPLKLYSILLCGDSDLIDEIVKISLFWDRRNAVFTQSHKPRFLSE